MGDFLQPILRFLLFWIDKTIYGFIPTIYNLFIDIAQTSVFTDEIFTLFATKIYTLLGIFMLFKVSFSILTYVVDPDAFLDKSKGFSKLIFNVIITLFLLLATPWIFSEAMDLQKMVLKNNILGKLFSASDVNNNAVVDPGNTMAYETLKAFYHLDTELFPECDGKGFGGLNTTGNACKDKIGDEAYGIIEQPLDYAFQTGSVSIYMDYDLLWAKSADGDYIMSYIPIMSTLAGGAIALLLIVFCFDVAVRSIKLGFLRLIAPVPIISRIDPKKGKSVFDNWVKSCISTYLDLFVRLLAIYFAIFVITQVIDLKFVDQATGSPTEVNFFVKAFIILGALLFAKQLPKLLEELFPGFKMGGKFTLNPMNKIRQTPLVGAGLVTGAALAGGAYTGFKAGIQAGHAGRGMWQGMIGAKRSISGKVPLMGDDKGGKSPKAFHTGMQSGYKEITGKDFNQFSIWKNIGVENGQKEIKKLKDSKYALQGEQAKLDASLQSLYDQLIKAKNEEEKQRLNIEIKENRKMYGGYAKNISSLDDQIKDIKRLYHIDDSPKKDVSEALEAAAPFLQQNNSIESQNNLEASPSLDRTSGVSKVKPVPKSNNKNQL